MNIYAISWVMSSYVDSYVKALFAQNSGLKLKAFIFPQVKVPMLEGVKIYTPHTAPIDPTGIYVDFSIDQKLSSDMLSWSKLHGISIISLQEWLALLCRQSEVGPALEFERYALHVLQKVHVPEEVIAVVEPQSRKLFRETLQRWQQLDLRALHNVSACTSEGFLLSTIEKITLELTAGIVDVYSFGEDPIFVQLSKVHFSLREMNLLRVMDNGKAVGCLKGRSDDCLRASVHFTCSSRLLDCNSDMQSQAFVVVHLERGLIDAEKALNWALQIPHTWRKIEFAQISSRLGDAFLICRFENLDV
jgi:hypothetical protein